MPTALTALRRAWQTDRALTGVGLLMVALVPLTAAGLLLDARLVAGAPVWLKPTKFAASTAIYSVSLLWVLSWLESWPRLRRRVSTITAAVFVLEVGIICVQAWRGTTSHFNVSTVLDGVLFSVMGVAIVLQTVASAAVAVALIRQPFEDRVMGSALRAAMVITILGASIGGLMTSPSRAQIQQAVDTGRMTASGSHTVGAPDGGPGLPGTGWSRTHGDLRVPHFVGLHALQVLPLLAVWMRRRFGRDVRRIRLAAASYGALVAILLVEALLGEALLSPGPIVSVLLLTWASATALGWVLTSRPSPLGATATPQVGGLA